ncbi:MAG: Cof-type HAD-IIB family hydrolase [Thermovirgaceae bacterium]
MGIRMIVLDLDGTLLTSQNTLTEHTVRAVAACMGKGITVTVATGRVFRSVRPFAEKLGLTDPLITANGAEIRSLYQAETLYYRPIGRDLARDVLAFFYGKGWYIQSYHDGRLFVEEADERAKSYGKLTFLEPVPLGRALYDMDVEPVKLLSITSSPEEAVSIRKAVQNRFGEALYAAVSNRLFVDMAHPEVSKARGLEILMEKQGISDAETMVVGDSENDLPLFERAGFSVAMGNARRDIREKADAVTLSSDEDGVALALERYVLKG